MEKKMITVQIDITLFEKNKQEAEQEDRTIAAQVRKILKEHYKS